MPAFAALHAHLIERLKAELSLDAKGGGFGPVEEYAERIRTCDRCKFSGDHDFAGAGNHNFNNAAPGGPAQRPGGVPFGLMPTIDGSESD